jgi:DUF1009 family protein
VAATVGIVAGGGRLPFEIARGARAAGRRVVAVALDGLADPALGAAVDAITWVAPGELGALLDALRASDAREAVLAGTVSKAQLYTAGERLRLDARGAAFLAALRDRSDDGILRALGALIESEGTAIVAQTAYASALLAPAGVLGAVAPSDAQRADVAFGWPIAKAIGRLDVGQTLVVKQRAVLAVEAIEGTDAAIRRGGALAGRGACVLKVWKPGQDPRFDAPTVGLDTLTALVETGASLLAVEAGRTLVLDRDEVVRRADAHGIALVGVPGDPA